LRQVAALGAGDKLGLPPEGVPPTAVGRDFSGDDRSWRVSMAG
jgi:hypothetical protein